MTTEEEPTEEEPTISTHTLTWSVTEYNKNCIDEINISTHTLTWSVTIRKKLNTYYRINFNSHAHVERDPDTIDEQVMNLISTHTLTWSVTLDVVYIWCLLNVMRTYFFI